MKAFCSVGMNACKGMAVFVLLCLSLFLGAIAVCGAEDMAVFHYDFTKPGSITSGKATDLSGNDNTGIVRGGVSIESIDGSSAAYLDGETGYIEIPSLASWKMKDSVSYSATVRLLQDGRIMGQDDAHDMIINKDDYFLVGAWPVGTGGKKQIYVNTHNGHKWLSIISAYDVRLGTWMQVDVRISLLNADTGERRAELYVDGNKIAEGLFVNKLPQENNNPIHIGAGFFLSKCWMLNGYIANIKMYDHEVTEREIVESARANPLIETKPEAKLLVSQIMEPKKQIGNITFNGVYIGDMNKSESKFVLQRIISDETSRTIESRTLTDFRDDKTSFTFDISRLPFGNYRTTLSCKSPQGELFEEVINWEKINPEIWKQAKAGITDEVIPPWTPLELQKSANNLLISCWGREYLINDLGLPKDILTRGEHILSGPIELAATVQGKKAHWESIGLKSTSATPAKITYKGAAKALAQGLRMDVESYAEFDGLIVSKFTVSAPKPTVVQECSVQIPLKKEHARFVSRMLTNSHSYRGNLENCPKSFQFPFYMWLGDYDRGVCWFSEHNLSTRLADKNAAVELIENGEEVLIKINLLDKPTKIDEPITFTLGFEATPVKPLPENWRSIVPNKVHLRWTTPYYNEHFGFPTIVNPELYRNEMQKIHDSGKMFIPYILLQMLSANTTEHKYYGDEWATPVYDYTSSDVTAFKPHAGIYGACANVEDWRNAITYRIKKLIEDYELDGLYHDFSSPILCRNQKHGCPEEGWYPILAMRELYKRTHTILKQQPRQTFHALHTGWSLVCAPVCAFADGTLNGEELTLSRGNGNYYKSFLPTETKEPATIDALIADYIGRQMGPIPIMWKNPLSGTEYEQPQYEQQLLGIMLLHDVLSSWGHWNGSFKSYSNLWGVLNKFRIDDAEFIPYWEKQKPIAVESFTPAPDEYSLETPVPVSIYNCSGDRALAVVANTAEIPLSAVLKIDRSALGFSGGISVKDAYEPGEDLLDGDKIKLEIDALLYKLLLIEKL